MPMKHIKINDTFFTPRSWLYITIIVFATNTKVHLVFIYLSLLLTTTKLCSKGQIVANFMFKQ